MKKWVVLFLFLLLGCSSANHFEINTEIKPTVFLEQETHTMALEYKLGDLLILDQLKYMDISKYAYIERNSENLKLHLNVEYKSTSGCCMRFRYNLGAVELGYSTNPVKAEVLMDHSSMIPGFVWYIRNKKLVNQKSLVDEMQEQTKKDDL